MLFDETKMFEIKISKFWALLLEMFLIISLYCTHRVFDSNRKKKGNLTFLLKKVFFVGMDTFS